MTTFSIENNILSFDGELVISTVPKLYKQNKSLFQQFSQSHIRINLSRVDRIDSAGVAFLDDLVEKVAQNGREVSIENATDQVQKSLLTFSSKNIYREKGKSRKNFFESIGDHIIGVWKEFLTALYLVSDSIYFAAASLFNRKGVRKGEFLNQCILIGMNALPIVALISFLIGFILALQSAAQLRQFGASIYVADLVAISMTREMGPIMTAIIFAGRSGSAIASEIATMVVTEETDALKSMGLNPIRYILVPKMYAISTMMPLLTMLSMIIGILGALVIGVTYLDLGVKPFYNEVVFALILKDILTGLLKSLVFAWIIVLVGAFYGFRVKGGAEGVGRATTASVVASIFMVIVADSLIGLFFYFGKGIEF
jgi:phospholipid/cholesterol/gamma-HCH transport system permease protein